MATRALPPGIGARRRDRCDETITESYTGRGDIAGDNRAPATVPAVRVEALFFDGCPNHDELVPRLRALLARSGLAGDLRLHRIESAEQAVRERFLGSPTVRVNGRDVDPTAAGRDDFGLKCRLYATDEGLRGMPPDEWILDAITAASP